MKKSKEWFKQWFDDILVLGLEEMRIERIKQMIQEDEVCRLIAKVYGGIKDEKECKTK